MRQRLASIVCVLNCQWCATVCASLSLMAVPPDYLRAIITSLVSRGYARLMSLLHNKLTQPTSCEQAE